MQNNQIFFGREGEAKMFNEFTYLFVTIDYSYFIFFEMYNSIVYFKGAKWNFRGCTPSTPSIFTYANKRILLLYTNIQLITLLHVYAHIQYTLYFGVIAIFSLGNV